MTVTRNDLGRDGLAPETQAPQHPRLEGRAPMGVHSDGSRELSGPAALERRAQAIEIPAPLDVPAEEFEPEARRLGVDAVGAADRGKVAVPERQALERGEQDPHVLLENPSALPDLERERGVDDV